MLKIICLSLLFGWLSVDVTIAQPHVTRDSLLTILKITNPDKRERQLVLFLRHYFADMPPDRLDAAKGETEQLLQRFQVANQKGINYFIEALCQVQLLHFQEAENSLFKAIEAAEKNDDDYLLYACFTHLGFIQTYQGNTTGAISSFRIAKKEATILKDAYMQVIIDINISDIYYRMNLYSQSLFYLNQAQALISANHIVEPKIKNAVINNVAETYFRIGNIDSLKKYNRILNTTKTDVYHLYVFQKRTDYYLDLLQHNYSKAISRMQQLRKDSLYNFDATDEQNLADAYFMANRPDSAKAIIGRLLASAAQNNHPEVKSHLYEVLGQIATNNHDDKEAASNFKMALGQAKEQIARLTRVDTISSQIKIDEIQGAYIQRAETYKRERLWMTFIIVVIVLTLIIGGLSYRNIKRKKYYEKLLFAAKTEELAFINSHEVRRHLSNIMGIIDTIKQSSDKHREYLEAEDHLYTAACNLDTAIKNIAAKLDA